MSAQLEAPPIYVGPAFVGWRAWRVMPHETLGGPASIRLCASGTNGVPKVWEPRQPLHAVCGRHETTHDSPWPSCQCGVHAYADRDAAWKHFESFVQNNKTRLAWAFGRVSLWGRIVEHELGWRAEHAYPYDLTVYGPAELAARVRQLYLVDVEAADVEQLPRHDATDDDAAPSVGLDAVRAKLSSIEENLAALRAPAEPQSRWKERMQAERARSAAKWDPFLEKLPPLPEAIDETDDRILRGVFAALARGREAAPHWWYAETERQRSESSVLLMVAAGDVLDGLLALRRIPGTTTGSWGAYYHRAGYDALLRQTRAALGRLEAAGLVQSGRASPGHVRMQPRREWRVTPAGVERLRKIRPKTILFYRSPQEPGFTPVRVTTEAMLDELGRLPFAPFEDELVAMKETWRQERQAAARTSRKAPRAWLETKRREANASGFFTEAAMMSFSGDEVRAALAALSRRGPVPAADVIWRLAPGATPSEIAVISQALFKLTKSGQAVRFGEPGQRRWRAATATA